MEKEHETSVIRSREPNKNGDSPRQNALRKAELKTLFHDDTDIPEGVVFYAQQNLSYFLMGVFILLATLAGSLHAFFFSINAPWNVHLFAFALDLTAMLAWVINAARQRKFKRKGARWGLFIASDFIIYRDIHLCTFITPKQYDKTVRHVKRESRNELTGLQIQYRLKRHLPPEKIDLGPGFNTEALSDIERSLASWHHDISKSNPTTHADQMKHFEDEAEINAWERKLVDIYRLRRWLPDSLVEEMPNLPCSTEAQKAFVDKLKAHALRIKMAQVMQHIQSALFGKIAGCAATLLCGTSLYLFFKGLGAASQTQVGPLVSHLGFGAISLLYLIVFLRTKRAIYLPALSLAYLFLGAFVYAVLF